MEGERGREGAREEKEIEEGRREGREGEKGREREKGREEEVGKGLQEVDCEEWWDIYHMVYSRYCTNQPQLVT